MRRLAPALVLWLGASRALAACPICFQGDAGPVTSGVHAAVAVLVAVTVSVLAGFAVFAVNLARAQEPLEPSEPPEPFERS